MSLLAVLAAATALNGCISVPTRTMDGYVFMRACNVQPPGWRSMNSAPRDGTVIEVRNGFSATPSISRRKWAKIEDSGEYGWTSPTPPPTCRDDQHGSSEIKDKAGKVIGWSGWSSCPGITFYAPDAELGLAWRPSPKGDR